MMFCMMLPSSCLCCVVAYMVCSETNLREPLFDKVEQNFLNLQWSHYILTPSPPMWPDLASTEGFLSIFTPHQ